MAQFTNEHINSIINDTWIHICLELILFFAFTIYFVTNMRLYYQLISKPTQMILVFLEIMMAAKLIYDIIIMTIYQTQTVDHKIDKFDTYLEWYLIFDGILVSNRISVIVLYRFMLLMKYAENTINENLISIS